MTQINEQKFITDGRIILSGKNTKRGERKKSDFFLFYRKNLRNQKSCNQSDFGGGFEWS